MNHRYILTFELRYVVYKEDSYDHTSRKYTIGEFPDFNAAVKVGNEFIERLNLDYPSTPGLNGGRLGTRIMGNVKNSIIRNYIRNQYGVKMAEIFVKISKVDCVNVEAALAICATFTSLEKLTINPLG